MSANATTAMHGQSTSVGPLGAAAVLTAVVAFGALGLVIGSGVRTTTVDDPVAGPVIDSTSMSGPRTGVQRGLGNEQAAIAATKDADASIVLSGAIVNEVALAGQRGQWLKAQAMVTGSDFAGQYEQWLAGRAAAASTDFPDYFQRINPAQSAAYGGSDFAGQYEQWLKAQAAASTSSFPDYFQRHEPTVKGHVGGHPTATSQTPPRSPGRCLVTSIACDNPRHGL